MNKRKKYYLIFIFLSAWLLTGCLGGIIKIAYNNGDYFIKNQIEDFINLNSFQENILTEGLISFFKWHRKEELIEIKKVMEILEKQIIKKKVSIKEINNLTNQLFQIRDRTAEQFIKETSSVLGSLTDKQMKRLEKKLKERSLPKTGDDDKTYLERTDRENISYYLEKRKESIKKWLGSLTPEQVKWLADYPVFDRKYYRLREENRNNFASILIDFLRSRPSEQVIQSTLISWIAKPELVQTKEYYQLLQERRKKLYSGLVFWQNSLTQKQKKKLIEEIVYYREVVEDLLN